MDFRTASPEETFVLGEKLAKYLPNGAVLCLTGNLGAGKTLLVQGVAAGFQVADDVTSPTFALMNVYQGKSVLYHFDLYRMESSDQLVDIGFDEYVHSGDGICFIEWPDRFMEDLPEQRIWIKLQRTGIEGQRLISIWAEGERYRNFYEELKRNCQS